jgi:predicted ATPase/class 3 adenylate cyclase
MTEGRLPTGTVTFLFTDIEGSTRLVETLGDRWAGTLLRHRELLRGAVTAANGVEVKSEGDGFLFVFDRAPAAVAAAAAAQQALASESWPDDGTIRVRMGIHTGMGVLDADGEYHGPDIHRASRIAAAGHGGQVLVSDASRALADGDLPSGTTLRALGEYRLRDLERSEDLYQLVVDDLPSDFPPLRDVGTIPSNLPTQLTTFLGREHELASILALLEGTRLLTLTGPGGTGKTRLGLETARRATAAFPDGVWFVALGTISEPDLVAPTIAQVLGLPDRGGRNPVERLIDHLRGRIVLVVLDNFEQVTDAAPIVNELLTACNRLAFLVTSRSALHLYGEREYPVPPLAIPDPAHLPDLATLSQFEAVALFVERARAVRPDFAVTDDNAPAVAEICYRLDGLPLAIELAAARLKVLSPGAILDRFNDRLSLLAGGARDLPARQQTLRGAIAWSYDMLEPADRALFACLSVFVGGGTIDHIEVVCGPAVEGDVFDGLASLVDKSLLRQGGGLEGQPRFAMLGTIREFAAEQLAARPDADDVHRRHAETFLALATETSALIMGPDKRRILDRLEGEHENLRAAVNWAIDAGHAELALLLTARLWRFWQMRGYLDEGRERTERAVAMPHAADHPAARLAALEAAGGLAYWQGAGDVAVGRYEEALALARTMDEPAAVANALYNLTFAAVYSTQYEEVDAARGFADEALEIYRRLGDHAGEARTLWAISNTYWGRRIPEEALAYAVQALALFRELGDTFMIGWCRYTIGLYSLMKGDLDEAASSLAECLDIFSEAQDVTGYVLVVDGIASLAWQRGDHHAAARLAGGVAELERRSGTGLAAPNRNNAGWDPSIVRDDPATAGSWQAGAELSADETVEAARAWLASLPAAVG